MSSVGDREVYDLICNAPRPDGHVVYRQIQSMNKGSAFTQKCCQR